MLARLCVIYGCHCTETAEWSCSTRDLQPVKPNIITLWPFRSYFADVWPRQLPTHQQNCHLLTTCMKYIRKHRTDVANIAGTSLLCRNAHELSPSQSSNGAPEWLLPGGVVQHLRDQPVLLQLSSPMVMMAMGKTTTQLMQQWNSSHFTIIHEEWTKRSKSSPVYTQYSSTIFIR